VLHVRLARRGKKPRKLRFDVAPGRRAVELPRLGRGRYSVRVQAEDLGRLRSKARTTTLRVP
jgi:hypothetical protein